MHILAFLSIFILILIAGFFSASETSMMSLNRYRLKHRAKKSKAARRAIKLLERPDRLLGMILIGNTFANILVSSITTILAQHYFGDFGVAVSTVSLTFIIILFAEILPKTFAAIQPERLAMPATLILTGLLKVTYPIVLLVNVITNTILMGFGVRVHQHRLTDPLTAEELKSVVQASGEHIEAHKNMLLGILDLEKATIKDVMLPRQNIYGLNLEEPWDKLFEKIYTSPYSKLPVYRGDIGHVIGILSIKKLINFSSTTKNPVGELEKLITQPYFVPETTNLKNQMVNFQKNSEKIALVVDEYGDIQGLVTLEDILEEIVGEFTSFNQPSAKLQIQKNENGCYTVDAAISLRDLHRDLGIELPSEGEAKTLGGLLVLYLDGIPKPHTCLKLGNYPIEILSVDATTILSVRIFVPTKH
jgi:Mg2+/Co2+ transporter CorB